MSKATQAKLAELHGTVARVLSNRLTAAERDDEGNEVEGTEGLACSTADIGAAITFLKNNSITADIEKNAELSELEKRLTETRQKRKLSGSDLAKAAADFDNVFSLTRDGTAG